MWGTDSEITRWACIPKIIELIKFLYVDKQFPDNFQSSNLALQTAGPAHYKTQLEHTVGLPLSGSAFRTKPKFLDVDKTMTARSQ